MNSKVAAVAVAVAALAAGLAGLQQVGGDDGGKAPPPPDTVSHPLITAAKVINDDVRDVRLPTDQPTDLNALLAWTDVPGRTEVHFATGTQNISICQAVDLTDTTCGQSDVTLLVEQPAADGQTWRVVLLPDDVQNGTADPAETIEWWTDADYTTDTPGWIVELTTADPIDALPAVD